MDNIYLVSIVIALIYLLAKFIEMRFIMKESLPMKLLVRDSLLVCFSTVCGLFIAQQLTPIKKALTSTSTQAFTGDPDF